MAIRLDAARVVHDCRRLLDDIIMPSAGGSSYFKTSPLQRMQRDVEVLKGHAMFDWDRVAVAGRPAGARHGAGTDRSHLTDGRTGSNSIDPIVGAGTVVTRRRWHRSGL